MNNAYSQSHITYLQGLKRHKIFVTVARFAIFIIFTIAWEITTYTGLIDSFIFSSPSRIIKCFIELTKSGILISHIGVTIYETLVCFAAVIILALLVATLMWCFRTLFQIFEPYLILLNSLPKSALAPVLIVWLGNNTKTIIVAAVSVAVFGAIMSLYTAFIETEPEKIKLIRTLGGSKWHLLTKLVIPSSIPTIISTMKVNLGLSLVGVIIGEFLAAKKGLGYLIIYGSQVFKMDFVLLSIVILCILSTIMYRLIHILEKKNT